MAKTSSRGLAFDALVLAFVKVVTLSSGVICTMILSRSLGLDQYGTYLQSNMVATLVASLTILGLGDAVNFFFNKDSNARSSQYVCTVFAIQLVLGIAAALVIVLGSDPISRYFENSALCSLMVYVALRPLCINLITSLQVLLVSVKKARLLAVRNMVMTAVKIAGVCFVSFAMQSVELLLLLLLAIDLSTVIWFVFGLKKEGCLFNPLNGSVRLLRPILAFSAPMAVYVMCSNISREVAKLVIGYYESTESFAVFSNCATVLPLDFISGTLLVVLIPVLTRLIDAGDLASSRRIFSRYLEIGYLTTVTFAIALLSVSEYAVLFLYGEKYLGGVTVFSIYLFAYMMQFASLSLVLSASGRTKTLMMISVLVLVVNVVLSPTFYFMFGFVGPAISSVVSVALLNWMLLRCSARAIHASVGDLFDRRRLGVFLAQSAGGFCLSRIAVIAMEGWAWNPYLIFFLGMLVYILFIGVLNGRRAIELYKSVNSFSG